MRHLATLLRKEFLLEFRTLETVSALTLLAGALVLMIAFGVESLVVPQETVERFFSLHCWIVFVFSSSLVLGRNLDRDKELGALSALLLHGVSPQTIFFSKLLTTSLWCWLGNLGTFLLLALFEGVSLTDRFSILALVSLFVSVAYSSLVTLLVALTYGSRLKSTLLPLILLPLLFPLFFAAHELSLPLFIRASHDSSATWFPLLGFLTLVYGGLGLLLYGKAIRG